MQKNRGDKYLTECARFVKRTLIQRSILPDSATMLDMFKLIESTTQSLDLRHIDKGTLLNPAVMVILIRERYSAQTTTKTAMSLEEILKEAYSFYVSTIERERALLCQK